MEKKAISHDIKKRIIGLYMGGQSNIEISRILKTVSPSCVSRTIAYCIMIKKILFFTNLNHD